MGELTRQSSPRDPLDELARAITETIAMTADARRVGVDGDEEAYERWRDRLHDAVDDGLEEVERRAVLDE